MQQHNSRANCTLTLRSLENDFLVIIKFLVFCTTISVNHKAMKTEVKVWMPLFILSNFLCKAISEIEICWYKQLMSWQTLKDRIALDL
jgi:hypothetical protein